MLKKIGRLIRKDKKLQTLFSGILSSGIALISIIIAASVFYL